MTAGSRKARHPIGRYLPAGQGSQKAALDATAHYGYKNHDWQAQAETRRYLTDAASWPLWMHCSGQQLRTGNGQRLSVGGDRGEAGKGPEQPPPQGVSQQAAERAMRSGATRRCGRHVIRGREQRHGRGRSCAASKWYGRGRPHSGLTYLCSLQHDAGCNWNVSPRRQGLPQGRSPRWKITGK